MTYIDPALPACVFLLVLAAAWAWRHRLPGRRLWALAAAGLFLWSFPPFAWLFSASLEAWYPATFIPRGDAGAIVVLSGGISIPNASRPAVRLDEPTYVRSRHAVWLHQTWRPLPIVVSGGPNVGFPQYILAEEMAKFLRSSGIPAQNIWLEARSYSTYQNARYTAHLLRIRGIRRIVLVTEGYHMLRSELCFRNQGLEVIPAPIDFHSKEWSYDPFDYLPSATAIRYNDQVLHEWVGLAYYWLTGKI